MHIASTKFIWVILYKVAKYHKNPTSYLFWKLNKLTHQSANKTQQNNSLYGKLRLNDCCKILANCWSLSTQNLFTMYCTSCFSKTSQQTNISTLQTAKYIYLRQLLRNESNHFLQVIVPFSLSNDLWDHRQKGPIFTKSVDWVNGHMLSHWHLCNHENSGSTDYSISKLLFIV